MGETCSRLDPEVTSVLMILRCGEAGTHHLSMSVGLPKLTLQKIIERCIALKKKSIHGFQILLQQNNCLLISLSMNLVKYTLRYDYEFMWRRKECQESPACLCGSGSLLDFQGCWHLRQVEVGVLATLPLLAVVAVEGRVMAEQQDAPYRDAGQVHREHASAAVPAWTCRVRCTCPRRRDLGLEAINLHLTG